MESDKPGMAQDGFSLTRERPINRRCDKVQMPMCSLHCLKRMQVQVLLRQMVELSSVRQRTGGHRFQIGLD